MESTLTYARPELLQVADTVARDKGIDRDEVLEAMEQAIQKAGRSKYGQEYDIRAEIDRAQRRDPPAALPRGGRAGRERGDPDPARRGASGSTPRPRSATSSPTRCRRSISAASPRRPPSRSSCRRCATPSAQRQFNEFKDRVGEIVNGLVKRVEFGNVVVDLGRAEAMLRRDELLPRESFRQGERVRAYIYDVRQEPRGPQIFLSRTHPQFMAKLFAQEVPEIYDGIIEIKAVARDPGSRAKIAVISHDSGIDPVGACVGMRGSRVQAVVGELQGEKIDIIPWSQDPATFVVNALAPAEVTKVVMDEEQRRIEVVVPDDQLSLAIGRRGQNVRLASQLTGWDIDILTEAEESERRTEEFRIAQPAVHRRARHRRRDRPSAGDRRASPRSRKSPIVALEDLAGIEGFDEDVATELQAARPRCARARDTEYSRRAAASSASPTSWSRSRA